MRDNISTNIVCALIMMALCLVIRDQKNRNYQARLYYYIAIATIIMLCIEIAASITFGNRLLTEVILTVYYSLMALLGGMWTIYICTLPYPELGKKEERKAYWILTPSLIYALVCLSNPFTHLIFTLLPDMTVDQTGFYIEFSMGTYYVYAAMDIYFIVKNRKKVKDKFGTPIVCAYVLMVGIAIIAQTMIEGWLVINAVFTVIFVVTYFSFQSRRVSALSKNLEEMEKTKTEAISRAMAEERFRLVARDSNDVVFEINLMDETVFTNENYVKTFGEEAKFDLGWEAKTVHPDDRKKFHEVRHRLQKAEKGVPLELRLKTKDGNYKWFLLTISAFTDDDGNITRIMGKYTDIDLRTHERELLKRRVQLDTATGLYNKCATEELISLALDKKGQQSSAILITDIDDLKKINDSLGHSEGDRAISMVAAVLKMHFRSTDIIGRIGGDEFMVLLDGMCEEDKIKSTLTALCRKMASLRVGEKNDYPVRCSMGVVISGPGNDFSELYREADKALYFVKRDSKNSFALYDPEMENSEYEYKDAVANLCNTVMFDTEETSLLLSSLAEFYPFIVSVNIPRNSYYILEYKGYGIDFGAETGVADDLFEKMVSLTYDDDRASLAGMLDRAKMENTYETGERTLLHTGRQQMPNGEYRWAKTIAILTESSEGNLYAVILMRAVNDRSSL